MAARPAPSRDEARCAGAPRPPGYTPGQDCLTVPCRPPPSPTGNQGPVLCPCYSRVPRTVPGTWRASIGWVSEWGFVNRSELHLNVCGHLGGERIHLHKIQKEI